MRKLITATVSQVAKLHRNAQVNCYETNNAAVLDHLLRIEESTNASLPFQAANTQATLLPVKRSPQALATRRSCLHTSDSIYNTPRSSLLEESNRPTKLEFK